MLWCLNLFSEPHVVLYLITCHLNDFWSFKWFTSRCCAVLGFIWGSCCLVSRKLSALMIFKLLISSRITVAPSLFFLQKWCHLINVSHSVSYFVCRFFTESTESPLLTKILSRLCFRWLCLAHSFPEPFHLDPVFISHALLFHHEELFEQSSWM